MKATTTRHKLKQKPFAWSYSKLKNYENCPKRHWHIDIARDVKEPESEQLKWGNVVHTVLEQRIVKGTELPPVHKPDLEKWALKILTGPGTVYGEQGLAITKDFGPTEWFSSDAWFRAKVDILKINGPVAIAVDWKTGRIVEDSVQLMLAACAVFAHYPEVKVVRSMYVWLKEDAETILDIKRADVPTIWSNLWSRIEALREAHDETNYPPTPNRLCRKWCPVKQCPHYGEAHGG